MIMSMEQYCVVLRLRFKGFSTNNKSLNLKKKTIVTKAILKM